MSTLKSIVWFLRLAIDFLPLIGLIINVDALSFTMSKCLRVNDESGRNNNNSFLTNFNEWNWTISYENSFLLSWSTIDYSLLTCLCTKSDHSTPAFFTTWCCSVYSKSLRSSFSIFSLLIIGSWFCNVIFCFLYFKVSLLLLLLALIFSIQNCLLTKLESWSKSDMDWYKFLSE